MNDFLDALADFCRKHLLAEKWLIAPSLRIGHQWLESMARGGQPCCNVRIKTLKVLALDLAMPEMARQGLSLLSSRGGAILMARACQRLAKSDSGYLFRLRLRLSLSEALHYSVTDLGLAGLDEATMARVGLEEEAKCREIIELWHDYRQAARSVQRMDYAEVLHWAVKRLKAGGAVDESVLVLLPVDVEAQGLENAMLAGLPARQRIQLPIDQPGEAGRSETPVTDAGLLRWILAPDKAPPPQSDKSAAIFRAVGEINEVREVFRRCLSANHRLDDVEVLYTDGQTYVPLIYEVLLRLQSEEKLKVGRIPATFAEGISCRYARPGRALALWLAWIRKDYPARILIRMIQEGLLVTPQEKNNSVSAHRLAATLRALQIGFGRDRYSKVLDDEIRRSAAIVPPDPEVASPDPKSPHTWRRRALLTLHPLIQELLEISQSPSQPTEILGCSLRFLDKHARAVSRLDNFALQKLRQEITEMKYWIDHGDVSPNLDIADWLEELPKQARVMAANPAPGCIHVAPLWGGGHSGRTHTMLVGLDDSRFPGANLQDPVILDRERKRLSPELRTSARFLRDKVAAFARLLARLRGTITLSYCCHNLQEDRQMFPSSAILAAYRILSGNHESNYADMLLDLPPAVSFTPGTCESCLDDGEWWLWRHGQSATPIASSELLVKQFPHLGRGFEATTHRSESLFTKFDGDVPQAGADIDPTAPTGAIVTTTHLETLGRCPLAYFFQFVLGLETPPDLGDDPHTWLNVMARGTLLHAVFEKFLRTQEGRPPERSRDWQRLLEILDAEIEAYKSRYPIPNASVFRSERGQLVRTARIFLSEEEEYYRETGNQPAFLEANLGLPQSGDGSPLDCQEPMMVTLPNGKSFRARGRIDRIDRVAGTSEEFEIWDYKTGGHGKYSRRDAYKQGRYVQNVLYLSMVNERLRQVVSPTARARSFGYFFPGTKSRGERIKWTAEEAAARRDVLERLMTILGEGAFLATNDKQDCEYCLHRSICGNVDAIAAASSTKLSEPANLSLKPFRQLRLLSDE
jgi:ATP-dependent helicase/nuclease subunit B